MDINEAVEQVELFLKAIYEYSLFGLGDDNVEAIETLLEFTKTKLEELNNTK